MRFGEFGLFSLSLALSWLLRDSFQLLLLRFLELTIGSEMCAMFGQEPCNFLLQDIWISGDDQQFFGG